MYINRPTLYDITNNPNKAFNDFDREIKAVGNDLYILVVGNNLELPTDIKNSLRSLQKEIDRYIKG